MKNILGIEADAKTTKGGDLGVLTGILYLAPANLSGYEVCPKASAGCRAACLFTAGRGKMKSVTEARIAKTKRFFEHRADFMADLVFSLKALEKKAAKRNMTPAARLNGTSDIAWEKISCVKDGVEYRSVIDAFPNIQFYDYTKIVGRKRAATLANYHLTFSLAENNQHDAVRAIHEGMNVAVAFAIKKDDAKPATWGGFPVIDGDVTDVRFMDPKGGHIVGLFAKGDAKKDTSGFVRKIDAVNIQ